MSSETRGREDGDPREQYERMVGFLRRAMRFWPTYLLVLTLGTLACVAFLTLRQPKYRSETLILYTEGIRAVDGPADPNRIGPRDAAVRLREMLLSRPRLMSTVDQFGLYPDVVAEYGPIDAAEKLREHIDFRAPGGDTFSIAFRGLSAEQAQAVTKHLADSLIDDEAGLRRKQAKVHREFLQVERKRTDEQLKKAERDIAQFLADHPDLAADAMLLMPGAPSTGAAIRAATAEAVPEPQAPEPLQWRTVRVPSGSAEPGSSAGSGAPPPGAAAADQRREIAAAKTRAEADLTAAQAALADKSARFTELHPDVRALKSRVARERSRVDAASAALATLSDPSIPVTSADPSSRSSGTMIRRVRVGTGSAAKPVAKVDEKQHKQELVALETDWARLTRTAAEARAKNEQIETSLFKAELSTKSEADGTGASMVVLDPAYLPARPMPPGQLTISAIFIGLALLLGGVVVAGRAAIDDRVYRGKDIERCARILVEVPPLSHKLQKA